MAGWHHWLNGHEFEQSREIVKDREVGCAAVRRVTKNQTRLGDWTTNLLSRSLPSRRSEQSLGSWKPGLLQGRGLGGRTHPLSTSRGEHDPHWTCKTAKDRHHLAAVWRPPSNERVVTTQLPLGRWPCTKRASRSAACLAKRRVDGAWELYPLVLLNQGASWVRWKGRGEASGSRGTFVPPLQNTSPHSSGGSHLPHWVLPYATTQWLFSEISPRHADFSWG